MMRHPRWRGRAFALWMGLLTAVIAVLVIVYLGYPELMVPAAVVTTTIAIVAGVARTFWLRAQDDEPLITVKDLRRR